MDEDALFKNRLLLDDKVLSRLVKTWANVKNDPASTSMYLIELDNAQLTLEKTFFTQNALQQEYAQLLEQSYDLQQQMQGIQSEIDTEQALIEKEKQIIEMKKDLDSIAIEIQKLPSLATLKSHIQALETDIQEIESGLKQSKESYRRIFSDHIEPQLNQLEQGYNVLFPKPDNDTNA
jgi:hypothetical protein